MIGSIFHMIENSAQKEKMLVTMFVILSKGFSFRGCVVKSPAWLKSELRG